MEEIYRNTDLFGNEVEMPKPKNTAEAKKAEAIQKKTASLSGEVTNVVELATIETIAKFKNTCITQVDVYRRNGQAPRNPNGTKNLLHQEGNETLYNGFLSPASRRQVEQMLSVWLTAVELSQNLKAQKQEVNREQVFPTFITLTLPSTQWHSDYTIKEKALKKFIEWLTSSSKEVFTKGKKKGQPKGFGVNVYLWRAEPQANKNIHFHIICDRYIPWPRIREKWNQCVEQLGYVTRYKYWQEYINRDGFVVNEDRIQNDMDLFKDYYQAFKKTGQMPKNTHPVFEKYINLLVKYKKRITDDYCRQVAIARQKDVYDQNVKCGWNNPNSTDIHAIQHLESVTAYVVKYAAKKPKEKPLKKNQYLAYDEITKKQCVFNYELVTNKYTGEIEKNITSWDVYKPEFLERKILGRIWGSSDTLRGFKPSESDEIITDQFGRPFLIDQVINEETGEVIKEKIPVPIMKFFTKTLSEAVVLMKVNKNENQVYVSPQEIMSQDTIDYIQQLCEIIGESEIERITEQVGESFKKMRGKIVPFRPEEMGFKPKGKQKKAIVKHSDILKKFAPGLYKEYVAYYQHIYNSIYQN